jgi:transcriptional repressor NrdR
MEQVVPAELVVVKRDDNRQEFNPVKIRHGIQKACWKRPVSEEDVDGLMRRIMAEIDDLGEREISSDQIGEIVMDEIRQVDQVAYVRFASVYRQFEHTEEFISEIRKLGRGRRRGKAKVQSDS